MKDKIVEEIRVEHASKFDYDLAAIVEDLKKYEKKSKLKVVSLPAKKIGNHV